MSNDANSPTQLNLIAITDKTPYIQKIKKALEKAVGQEILIIGTGEKVKRLTGVSVKPVDFIFTGNQKLTLFIRAGADVIRASLNDKNMVLAGDFSADHKPSFDRAVEFTGKEIRDNQAKFEKQQLKEKAPVPKREKTTISSSPTVRLGQLKEQENKLDSQINEYDEKIVEIQAKIKQIEEQKLVIQEG